MRHGGAWHALSPDRPCKCGRHRAGSRRSAAECTPLRSRNDASRTGRAATKKERRQLTASRPVLGCDGDGTVAGPSSQPGGREVAASGGGRVDRSRLAGVQHAAHAVHTDRHRVVPPGGDALQVHHLQISPVEDDVGAGRRGGDRGGAATTGPASALEVQQHVECTDRQQPGPDRAAPPGALPAMTRKL